MGDSNLTSLDVVTSPLGMTVKIEAIKASELELPTAFAESRQKLFTSLAERRPRDTIESIAWDDDLRAQAFDYVKKYRRALRDASEPEIIKSLLQLDTLTVTARGTQDWIRGVVPLPTHPLRFAWVAAHDQILRGWADQLIGAVAGPRRKLLLDAHLASRVTPANMPFTVVDADARVAVYAEELTHGTALYLPADIEEPEAAADVVAAVLGIPREGVSLTASADLLKQRLEAYQATHPGLGALRFLVINPGSGELLSRVIQPVAFGQDDEETEDDQPPRIEVVGYSDNLPFTDPLARLTDIQRSLLNHPREGRSSHLAPPLGIAARPTSRVLADGEGHHIAVIQDLAVGQIEVGEGAGAGRVPSFQDLLTPLITERIEDEQGGVAWCVGPALKARGGRIGSDIVDAHMQHQLAVGQLLGGGKGVTLRATLGADQLAMVDAVHQRADWVITIDRSIGLDFYGQGSSPLLTPGYVLDYAPDFIDGLSNRITVTTAHRPEVLRLLDDAMTGLRLAALSGTATLILDRLQIVSGRLALRLLGDTSLAREAVSLAALVAHLQERGKLDGIIVVPVDAHPEIFGPARRQSEGPARRCDLLLVKLTSRSFNIECVEVKSRKDAALPSQLADRIVEQLTDTRDLLINQFFADDPPRVDIELQRSRLAGILHYYADRAAGNELIHPDRLPEMHRNIDRIEETGLRPVITLHGYVVSLEGAHGFPESHRGVSISVLTANDLGQAGFTTVKEIEQRDSGTNDAGSGFVSIGSKTTEQPGARADQKGGDQHNEPQHIRVSTLPDPTDLTRDRTDHGVSEHGPTAPPPIGGSENRPPTPKRPAITREGPIKDDDSVGEDLGSATVELGVDAVGMAATWTISTKGSPHAFLLGIPGQGKSVTTRRIIRSFAACHLPSLVFDFHGDMAANPPDGARVIDASKGLPFSPFELTDDRPGSYKTAAWEISEVVAFVSGMGTIQRTSLFNGLVSAYEACGAGAHSVPSRLPTMQEFADAVAETEQGRKAQNARERLIPLTDFGLFAEGAEGTFDPREGVGTIVDVSRLMEAVQLAGGSFLLRKVYRDMFRWGQGDRLRLAVILDEAHRLAKDVTLPKLMKEGRKYGVAVVVASQNLTDFHKDVVGNAGTKIVFRTNFPESKQVAGFLKGRRTLDITNEIERLDVGQAFVSTPDHSAARKVNMHLE
jgi:DNA phosphorothioation-dependent restriction protein DptH